MILIIIIQNHSVNNNFILCFQPIRLQIAEGKEVKMPVDLCSENAFKAVDLYPDLLPSHHITLEWIPAVNNTDEILASEIVLAAVGKGKN